MPDPAAIDRVLALASTVTALAPVRGVELEIPGPRNPIPATLPVNPGELVSAKVERILADGTARLAIAGREVHARLPDGARAGDVLTLRYVTDNPRLQFELPRADLAAGAPARLSETSRLVAAIARSAPESPETTAGNIGSVLLDAPPDRPADVAAALRGAVTRSGRFYESHQADWIAGKYPLAELEREPQARLAQRVEPSPTREMQEAGQTPVDATRTPAPASTAGGEQRSTPVHPDALPIVRDQLAMLEHRAFAWAGEAWPGQQMRWEIARDDRGGDGSGPDQGGSWSTGVELELPQLGTVRAAITLTGKSVTLTITTPDGGTAKQLTLRSGELAERLSGAGLEPGAVRIRRE